MLVRHMLKPFSLIPIKSPTTWRDRHSQKSVIVLKVIWLLLVFTSLGLMIHQIHDSTSAYLSGTQVLSTTASDVPINQTFWVCFDSSHPLNETRTMRYAFLMFYLLRNRFDLSRHWILNEFKKNDIEMNPDVRYNPIRSTDQFLESLRTHPLFPFVEISQMKTISEVKNVLKDIRLLRYDNTTRMSYPSPVPCLTLRICYNMRRSDNASGIPISQTFLRYVESFELLPQHPILYGLLEKTNILYSRASPLLRLYSYSYRFEVTVRRKMYEMNDDAIVCSPTKSGDVYFTNCMDSCMVNNATYVWAPYGKWCRPFIFGNSLLANSHQTFCNYSNYLFRPNRTYSGTAQYPTRPAVCKNKTGCANLLNCKNPEITYTLTTMRVELLRDTPEYRETEGNSELKVVFKAQENIKKLDAKSTGDFLADIGGIIGLYFGFSFIGVTHIIFYCVYIYLRSRAKRKYGEVANKFVDSQTKKNIFDQLKRQGSSQIKRSCIEQDQVRNDEVMQIIEDNLEIIRELLNKP